MLWTYELIVFKDENLFDSWEVRRMYPNPETEWHKPDSVHICKENVKVCYISNETEPPKPELIIGIIVNQEHYEKT